MEVTPSALVVRVSDSGPGVPDGFSLDRDAGLGLTIVRTFVVHDLGGTVSIRAASGEAPRGAVVEVIVPRDRGQRRAR
jgi:two-component sensor histidine kinase